MTYSQLSADEARRIQEKHTKQVNKLKDQIGKFSRDNFSEYLTSDGAIVSVTCIPNFIDFADPDAVAELKAYVAFLHNQLQDYDPQNGQRFVLPAIK